MSSKSIIGTMFIVVACGSLLVDLKAVQAQDTCGACSALAEAAQPLLNAGMPAAEVVETIKQECDLALFEGVCLEIADTLGILIVDQLSQSEKSPDDVCHIIGLC